MNLIQTGETLGKNNSEFGGYAAWPVVYFPPEYMRAVGSDAEENNGSLNLNSYNKYYDYFSYGFYGRYGMTESLDVGFRTTGLILPFIWDVKYNLIGNKKTESGFSMSLIGTAGIEDMDGFYQVSSGVVSSYRFLEDLQIYTAVRGFRFVGKMVQPDLDIADSSSDSDTFHVYNGWSLAGTAGISLETGSKNKVSFILRPEITFGKFWVDKSIVKNQDDKYVEEQDDYRIPQYILVPSFSVGVRF